MIDHPHDEAEALAWWTPRVPPGFVRSLSTPPDAKPWTLFFVYPDDRVVILQVSPEGDLLLRHREAELERVKWENPTLPW